MSAPYNLRSAGAPKAGEPQPNVPQTDAPRADAPDNESSPTGQLTVEDLFKRMAADMARLQTVLQGDIKQLQPEIRSDLADHNTHLERLERGHVPTPAVDHPAPVPTAKVAARMPPVAHTTLPAAELNAAAADQTTFFPIADPIALQSPLSPAENSVLGDKEESVNQCERAITHSHEVDHYVANSLASESSQTSSNPPPADDGASNVLDGQQVPFLSAQDVDDANISRPSSIYEAAASPDPRATSAHKIGLAAVKALIYL
ncbi:hypothetical protein SEPCBS119000_004092 [Sporothrix epigloea]|uniref:Uncharacterized protein n=1 Tax=Sporothrix epigloea TaxID=1892477 RepID=A0ABP0DQ76_9PEZI